MAAKLFLSCADEERQVGDEVARFLNETFEHELEIAYYRESHVGPRWAKKTRDALRESDALVLLLSRTFRLKPWLYVEFAAFWFREIENVFILQLPDAPSVDEMPLLRDFDILPVGDPVQLQRFLEGVRKLVGREKAVPRNCVEKLREAVARGLQHSDRAQLQPGSMEFLARASADSQDFDAYRRYVALVYDDRLLESLAIEMLGRHRNAEAFEALEQIVSLARVREVFRRVFDTGFDTDEVRSKLLDLIQRDNGELRNVGIHLMRRGFGRDPLFDSVIERMTNNAEIRNLALRCIEEYGFTDDAVRIASHIQNNAELKNLLLKAKEWGHGAHPNFVAVFDKMTNEKHRKVVLEAKPH